MKRRIVDQLSKALGGTWRAVREPGVWSWHWTDGARTVRAYSESRLDHDGYSDEHFNRVYIMDETGTRVGLNGVIFAPNGGSYL